MLKAKKCLFEISSSNLSGFLVSHWGIKMKLEEVQAKKLMCPNICPTGLLRLSNMWTCGPKHSGADRAQVHNKTIDRCL